MTDKKLKVSNLAFTELSIKIATLDMKLNKVLELLNKPNDTVNIIGDVTVTGNLSDNENFEDSYK